MTPIRVVIADDQFLFRAGFRVIVESEEDLIVVGEAADGREAVRVVATTKPHVVLMDVRMPTMDGIEATRRISSSSENTLSKVIILTTFDLDQYVYAALRAGASGFLLKDSPPDELLNAIRVVSAGDALLAPSVTRRLIAEFAQRREERLADASVLERLTAREREVLVAVSRGRSNAEIGEDLHMSAATAKTHVGRLLSKLDARDRTQLVVLAYETGLVQPG